MTRWRQPWAVHELAGLRFELQILDPQTADEVEPEIVEQLGEEFSLGLAAPLTVLGAIGARALADNAPGPAAARALLLAAERIVDGLQAPASWMISAFERMVLGRMRAHGRAIDTWADLTELELAPRSRWAVLGVQVSQTFADLWVRKPYQPGVKRGPDLGVPAPNVPRAVAWAAALAREGYASSSIEILETWTPLQLHEHVELLAEQVARMQAAQDAAHGGR